MNIYDFQASSYFHSYKNQNHNSDNETTAGRIDSVLTSIVYRVQTCFSSVFHAKWKNWSQRQCPSPVLLVW